MFYSAVFVREKCLSGNCEQLRVLPCLQQWRCVVYHKPNKCQGNFVMDFHFLHCKVLQVAYNEAS